MAHLLLTCGANVNAREPHTQQTPLHIAVTQYRVNPELVRTLVAAGANAHATSTSGNKPIKSTQDSDLICIMYETNTELALRNFLATISNNPAPPQQVLDRRHNRNGYPSAWPTTRRQNPCKKYARSVSPLTIPTPLEKSCAGTIMPLLPPYFRQSASYFTLASKRHLRHSSSNKAPKIVSADSPPSKAY